MTRQKPAPIIVMSFNRANYLARVLASLKAQTVDDLDQREICLFQDGAVNRYSGKRHAEDKQISASIEIFQSYFPNGKVMHSPDNIGVALNFDRAESYVFDVLGADYAIFLEDDMELSPHYLQVLETLVVRHADDSRVGYVAAYGDHRLSLDEQERRCHEIESMTHNWAFALYRRHWLRARPLVTQYLDLVRGVDYRDRDSGRILGLFKSWDFDVPETSQDVAKSLVCCLTDTVKLNTVACNSRYIGEVGLHMNESIYHKLKFGDTQIFPRAVTEFKGLDDVKFWQMKCFQMFWAKKKKRVTSLSDVDFVHAIYQGILGRAPDPSGLQGNIMRINYGTPPELIIRSILESRESLRRNAAFFAGKADETGR